MSKVIQFGDNNVSKLKEELAEKSAQVERLNNELEFYRGVANQHKAVSELLQLQVVDLKNNLNSLKVQLNTAENNLLGLERKAIQAAQMLTPKKK